MAIGPQRPVKGGGSSSDPRVTEMLTEVPPNEVFVKTSDGSWTGTGMLLLQTGKILAPEGFGTESGSVDFGDLITLSESSGFLAIQNNLNNSRYRLIDHYVPKDAPSSKPGYVQMIEAENEFVAQSDTSKTITTNPLIFSYTTKLMSRVNSLKFKAAAPMANVRIKITATVPNVAVKYYPSKSAWVEGVGGSMFKAGDNILDFQDTPLMFEADTDLTYEIRANSVSILGNSSNVPYLSGMIQKGQFRYMADLADVPKLVSQLTNDKGYITAADVPTGSMVTWESVQGKPSIYPPSAHTHPISDIINLQSTLDSKATTGDTVSASKVTGLSAVATSGSYDDLSNKPSIPDSTSDLVNDSGYLSSVSWTDVSGKPVTFPPSAHSHAIADVTGLQSALDGKRNYSDAVSYNDLTNKPAIPTNTNQLTNGSGFITASQAASSAPVQSVNGQTGAVTLSIPAVQVNSDWNATSGVAQILNKPTTLAGYGITDAASLSALSGYATTSALASGLSTKYNTPSGTMAQYVRGDGSLATFPTIPTVSYPVTSVNGKTGAVVLANTDVGAAATSHTHVIGDVTGLQAALDSKASTSSLSGYATTSSLSTYATTAALTAATSGLRKVETFLGTSDASGNLTITFANTYTTAPDVQPQIVGGTFNQFVRIVSVSNTQAVIQVAQRNTVTLLSIEVLLGATVVVAGASITVQVTPRT